MSDLMKKFLTAYIEWVDAGAPEGKPFCRGYGLCSNSFETEGSAVERELKGMFEADGLERTYPFGEADYDAHSTYGTHHLHQPRIDWVRKQLAA